MSDLGSGAIGRRSVPDPLAAPSAAAVLGGPAQVASATADLLTHNPLNAVTGGIWRIRAGERTVIVKLLTDGRGHEGPAGWAASSDRHHWNWWEREVRVYGGAIPQRFEPDGLGGPALLAIDRVDRGTAFLWLEDVVGAMPTRPEQLADLATRLGSAQARLAREPIPAWASRSFLASYADSKPVDATVFDDDAAWAHPLVATHLAPLRDDLRRLHEDRHRLYAVVARCPRTLCHLDLWPANVVARPDGRFALLDWAFCGDGAIGEDIGNLIPDSVFDLFIPVDQLPRIEPAVVGGYLAGLAEARHPADPDLALLALHASAAKYHWLAERLVRSAANPVHLAYGRREVAAEDLYAARGAGLAMLCRWADDARQTATHLGWW